MLFSGSSSPLSVCRDPLVTVVEPLTPVLDAVHVLATAPAVSTSSWDLLRFETRLELVTDPSLNVPCVLTSNNPAEKRLAGPTMTDADGALPVTGVADPPDGNVTVGAGPWTFGGPSNRLTLTEYPRALPRTAVTCAVAGCAPTAVRPDKTRTATSQTRVTRDLDCTIDESSVPECPDRMTHPGRRS